MKASLRHVLTDGGMRMRAIRSILLTGLSFSAQNVLRLAGNLILTRILFPEAFGLMAIVFVVIGALNNLSDLGINSAIIQDEEGDKPSFLNTAWVLQILRGTLIALLVWLAADPIAAFYEQPILAELLPIAGLGALIQGFNSTKMAMAERELQLGRVTVLQIASQIIGLVATILFALWLKSIWGLVIGYLVGTIATALLSHVILNGPENRLAFEARHAGKILSFGAYIFLASIGGFLIAQGDRAILGKIATLEDLAFYNIAFFLASVPAMLAHAIIDKVIFPLYSRRPPSESDQNRRKIFQARWAVTGGGTLALMTFSYLGDPLIELLYDPRYHGAGAFMAVIALGLMPSLATASYMALALAAGDSGRFAIMAVGSALIQTVCMLLGGLWFGAVGVIAGLAIAPFLYHPPSVLLIRRYRGWDPLHDAVFALIICGFVAIRVAQGVLAPFGFF